MKPASCEIWTRLLGRRSILTWRVCPRYCLVVATRLCIQLGSKICVSPSGDYWRKNLSLRFFAESHSKLASVMAKVAVALAPRTSMPKKHDYQDLPARLRLKFLLSHVLRVSIVSLLQFSNSNQTALNIENSQFPLAKFQTSALRIIAHIGIM